MESVLWIISIVVLAALSALIAYSLSARHFRVRISELELSLTQASSDLKAAEADFLGRQAELRNSIADCKAREVEAVTRLREVESQNTELQSELKTVLEEKGIFKSEAARVEEARNAVSELEAEAKQLNLRLTALEREKGEALKDAEAANKRASDMVAKEREAQQAIVAAKDEQIAKLNDFIGQAREVLTTEFKALSADALKGVSEELVKTADGLIEKHSDKSASEVKAHKQQIETMLKPVEETIKRLDKHVEDSNVARSKAEALLDDQVKRLAGASESLTNALRKPVVRGSWGEMTLENALENAGLEAEIDYVLQHYTDAEDGRKRTDAIVNLPKGRKLIIDSKNMMETFIALANATDEQQRSSLADQHSKALKGHIKALASKEYWRRYDGLDCVILFIPHDGMYHAAIQDEAELIRDACEKRVFVANPMSLIPLLKAIRFVLDQDRLNKSAEEISKVGAELYVEVARFAENLATVGKRLKSTVTAYNEAIPGLDRFIVSKSRALKQLGSAKGSLPELPEMIEVDPKLFSSRELRGANAIVTAEDSEWAGVTN